ncbi:MAG: O-antigen ligase domain-containing protein [Actinobacteria bacterium]|nr:MAG: O-antigen ligase domain-containing protein [Actinomycetota bacterium]
MSHAIAHEARPTGRRAWRYLALAGAIVLASALAAFLSFAGVQWPTAGVLLSGTIAVTLAAVALASPRSGLVLLLMAIPLFDFATLGPPSAPFTAAHVLLGGTILGWLARVVRDRSTALPAFTPLLGGLGLLVVAGLGSLIASLAPATTAFNTFRLLALFLLAMVVMWRASTPEGAFSLVRLLVWVAVALVGVEAVQYLLPGLGVGRIATQGLESTALLVRPAAFFLDPNFLAGYLSAAALACGAMLVRARSWHEGLVWAVPGAITAAGMLVTFSRTAWVGFAVGAVLVLLTAPAERRKKLIIVAVVIAVAAVPFLPSSITARVATIFEPQASGSLSTRYLMVVSSVQMLGQYWLGGTGLGGFELAYPPYRQPGSLARILHPHQLFLALWVEMGLLGLLAELVIVAGIAIAWRRVHLRGYPGVSAAVLAGSVALVVESFFQYYLYFEYLWLFLALLAAVSVHRREVPGA